MSPPLRVLVISTVTLYREGLCSLLAAQSDIQLIGALRDVTPHTALDLLQPVDVILIDAAVVQPLTVARLRERLRGTRVLAIAVHDTEDEIVACAEAGVDSLVAADATVEELVGALRRVADGDVTISTSIAAALFRHVARNARPTAATRSQLTSREAEIVTLIDAGLSNKQIALRLSLTLPTVKNHVHNILQKLGVTRRSAAAASVRGLRAHAGSGSGSTI